MNGWIRGQKIISPAAFAFLLCIALWNIPRVCAATFTASLDRDTITLGESATLSLTFEGGQPKNAPTPDVPGLQIVSAGNSQNFSFVNGRMSSTVTVTYSVTPRQTGEFVIPSLIADIGGQQLSSQPLKLTVLKPNAPSAAQVDSGSQLAFMKLTLPKTQVFAGEIITAQLQVFLRDDVQNFGNFQFNAVPADGFTVGKMIEGGTQRAQIGNHIYTVVPISIALTAIKTGTLNVGPIAANATVVVADQNGQNQDQFFRQFGIHDPFGGFGGEQKQVSLVTEAMNIQSLPLPTQNVPANFNGAVGNYTMTVTAGPTNVAVGDPITIRVQISGSGALDAIALPNQNWNDFKVFSPTSKTQTTDKLEIEGTKTFEEIVTPENANIHELPQFSFSFFNPDDGNYHTLTQPATPLTVKPASATPLPTIAATKNSSNENQTPQDILPIKENLGALAQASPALITRPVFLALQSVPFLAFLAAFIWRKRADNLANNPRLRRRLHIEKLVQAGIADLKKFAAENNPEEFFAALFRLLQEQLGEQLDCPASSITEDVIDERLIFSGAPETALNDLRELFQLCNQARYAPVRGSSELNSVAVKFENVVSELQNVKV